LAAGRSDTERIVQTSAFADQTSANSPNKNLKTALESSNFFIPLLRESCQIENYLAAGGGVQETQKSMRQANVQSPHSRTVFAPKTVPSPGTKLNNLCVKPRW
jgi:hypothetical protein